MLSIPGRTTHVQRLKYIQQRGHGLSDEIYDGLPSFIELSCVFERQHIRVPQLQHKCD